ncbi:MAG: MmcQ/YjbR family DNA-binding protein [Frankia sp.]
MGNLERIEALVADLPEVERVDIEAWDGEPTFRVRGKNFVFSAPDAGRITVKLPKEEAAAVVATDPAVSPMGYGLGRHGWISVTLAEDEPAERWELITEWIRTSYTLVAPRSLARTVEPPGP